MPISGPIPQPNGQTLLVWDLANPGKADELIGTVNLLQSMQVRPLQAGIAAWNLQQSIMRSDQAYILNLPIFWANGVPADASAYAGGSAAVSYSQAEITALKTQVAALTQLANLILAGERSVQQLPGVPT